MKYRLTAILLALTLVLTGCAPVVEQVREDAHIYASFYPVYALGSLVLDGVSGIRLSCLSQPQDGCLRSYEISDWELHLLSYDADAVILGGKGLESYGDMLYSLGSNGPAIINAMYSLNLYNDDGDDVQLSEDSSHLDGENPYYYMSVYGAGQMVENIAESLCELFPDKAQEISKNAVSAQVMISDLSDRTKEICAGLDGQKVILLNEAMIYPAMEYDLEVEYWYDRESGDTLYGAGLESLLEELSQCESKVILIEKQAPTELTRALEEAGYSLALLDTMTSYALDAGAEGYIAAQLENAGAIAQAYDLEDGI
jgi:ABC-type Zn uptake system ZnuABC Zn-binding protein ZnuA